MRTPLLIASALLFSSVMVGCGGTPGANPTTPTSAAPSADMQKLLLAAEPAGAKGVIAIKKEAKDGDEVVLVGRAGGNKKAFTPGRASFIVVDLSLEACDDDGCGDAYCAIDRDELRQATALVKFVDEAGKTLNQDAKELFGLRDLDTVVVRGRVKRGNDQDVTIVASGLYPRR